MYKINKVQTQLPTPSREAGKFENQRFLGCLTHLHFSTHIQQHSTLPALATSVGINTLYVSCQAIGIFRYIQVLVWPPRTMFFK
jgi:hypothetical protein